MIPLAALLVLSSIGIKHGKRAGLLSPSKKKHARNAARYLQQLAYRK
jgi:hypothetical protein